MSDEADQPLSEQEAKDEAKKVPHDSASVNVRRGWVARIVMARGIGRVVRYGATKRTPMTVEVLGWDGAMRTVFFEEERDAEKHGSLRSELIRQGRVRAGGIVNGKVAGDVYHHLCGLARVVGASDPHNEIHEWVSDYRAEAIYVERSFRKPDLYDTLDALRNFHYSKHAINTYWAELERAEDWRDAPERPKPPIFVDHRGNEWTSISHLATFIRWDREHPGVISNEHLAGLVLGIGGGRWEAKAWDATTRQRQHRIITVLVRLPKVEYDPLEDEHDPYDGPGEEDV